jgi:hypothetical protein
VGQSCLWFSQGCSIGCAACDGVSAREQRDLCGSGARPTICDPRLRTYNANATCGTEADTYRHNPWRAPGTAPVFDPCGRAGGGNTGAPGPGAAFFTNTSVNRQGDLGSRVLPARPGTTWRAGSVVEAKWSIRANHGGGWQYRLCARSEPLTEACLQRTPLAFTGKMWLEYRNGTRQALASKYAYADGTGIFPSEGGGAPAKGAWALNPIPDANQRTGHGLEFEAPCVDDLSGPTHGLCSGERPFHISLVDGLRIPSDLPAGEYVLGWRWDVEETAQVWASCADVSIVA